MAQPSTERSGEPTTIISNIINPLAACYTMAKRPGLLASHYAFIDDYQNPYGPNHVGNFSTPEIQMGDDPNSQQTYIPDLPPSFIKKGIEASRYAPQNYDKSAPFYLHAPTPEPIASSWAAAAPLNQISDSDSQQAHIPKLPQLLELPLSFKPKGISASRYAPQNYNKPENVAFRQSYRKKDTTTLPSYGPKTSIPSVPRAPVFMRSSQLPYKIQHRFLTAIQTLLEECCYDYAVQWLPHVLEDKNWTCSEAVEMAKWKEVLSGPLPEGSITLSGHYSLNNRLSEAVRIRNITAHREPCDNNSIRKMISSAQSLVEIFKDDDRVNRLGRLRDEIDDWERSEGQPQAASVVVNGQAQDPRKKLHNALQEITEHPFEFDEMDWEMEEDTPQDEASVEEFGDEMEMDWE